MVRVVRATTCAGLALALCASCARDDGGAASVQGERGPCASVDPAARLADLRGRFPIGPGAGARFEPIGASGVRAVVPAAAKRAVLRSASVELPAHADGAVSVTDDATGVRIGFAMSGARHAPVATAPDGLALYAGGGPGGSDIVHRLRPDGTEDFVVFEERPARDQVTYEVDVSRVAGLRLVERVLEFLDAGGTPRLRVAHPYVVGADGLRREATIAVEGCDCDADPAAPWRRPVTRAGASRCDVLVGWAGAGLAYPAMLDPSWTAAGSMTTAREQHTATLLPSGDVLIAGGTIGGLTGGLSSAELFDGVSSFAATGSMTIPRHEHTATLLPSGDVLIAGGETGGLTQPVSSAEIYDAGTGSFAATGSMSAARFGHTATRLGSGQVLVAGGAVSGLGTGLASAELFDEAAGGFTTTGSMTTPRIWHTATLLGSGQVLVAGGVTGNVSGYLASAELFDGVSTFTATGSMTTARSHHAALRLGSGQVLVTGGSSGGANTDVASAELFDGVSTFTATGSMTTPRDTHVVALLGSGKVLVAGGQDDSTILSSAELFDGASSFAATAAMSVPREDTTATLLGSGKVLVAGGFTSGSPTVLATAEIFSAIANGGPCAVGGDCDSGACDDGVCCAAACPGGGVCQTCLSGSGACAPVTGADDPDTCTGARTCDASGACKLKDGQASADPTACASGWAADGVCCDTACAAACDVCTAALGATADGACTTAPAGYAGSPPCGAGLACDGTDAGCPGPACASDLDCLPSDYCAAGGACQPRHPQGAACNFVADCRTGGSCRECATGFCVDGVCCESACDALCVACAAALQQAGPDGGAPQSGECAPAKDGTDPHGDACPRDPTNPCGADGTCNGTGACRLFAPAGTSCAGASAGDPCSAKTCSGTTAASCDFVGGSVACGRASCTGGTATLPGVCDGTDRCKTPAPVACDTYACGATACKARCASDADCAPGNRCDAATQTCVSSATCDGDHTVTGANDVRTDCSPYKCAPNGTCFTACASVDQCVAPDDCDTSSGRCIAPPSSGNGGGGGCATGSGGAGGGGTALGTIAFAAAALRRRRGRACRSPLAPRRTRTRGPGSRSGSGSDSVADAAHHLTTTVPGVTWTSHCSIVSFTGSASEP